MGKCGNKAKVQRPSKGKLEDLPYVVEANERICRGAPMRRGERQTVDGNEGHNSHVWVGARTVVGSDHRNQALALAPRRHLLYTGVRYDEMMSGFRAGENTAKMCDPAWAGVENAKT